MHNVHVKDDFNKTLSIISVSVKVDQQACLFVNSYLLIKIQNINTINRIK